MATLQFKRVFNYIGSFDDALYNIKNNLNPALADGEPLVCSYKENDEVKFFLAIGAGNGRVVVHPTYNSQSDFIASIKKYADIDLTKMFAEDSDVTVTLDSETNKYTLKVKEDVFSINWIQL